MSDSDKLRQLADDLDKTPRQSGAGDIKITGKKAREISAELKRMADSMESTMDKDDAKRTS